MSAVQELIALTKSTDTAEVEKAVAQLAEMAAAHDKDTGRVLHHDRAVYQEHMTGLGGLERFIALSKSESLTVRRSASLGLLNLSFAVLNSHEIIAREGVQAVLRNMHDQVSNWPLFPPLHFASSSCTMCGYSICGFSMLRVDELDRRQSNREGE